MSRQASTMSLGSALAGQPTVTKVVTTTKSSKKDKKSKKRKAIGLSSLAPNKKFMTLVFTKDSGLTTAAVQSQFGSSELFRLNSIYEPFDGTVVNRAQGWNEVNGLYRKYKVFGCKIIVTLINPTIDGIKLGCRLLPSQSTDVLSGETLSGANMKRWTSVTPLQNTGEQKAVYSRYIDIKAIEGLTKLQFNADKGDYSAVMAANPANDPHLEVATANSASGAGISANLNVKIIYYVEVFDRKTVPNSTAA